MAIIPSSTRFVGIAPSVNLTEKKSNQLNSETQPYTMQDFQDSISPDLSPIVVDGNSVGIDADPTVTLQQVAVIESLTANAGIVLKPNGTGAIMAQVPDGTGVGGNARGTGAIDLQLQRSAANGVASGNYSVISGGSANRNSGGLSTISGGFLNVATGGYNYIGGGQQNTTSSDYSTISGGQSNTASTNTHATVVGGQGNTSSGSWSISGGHNNVASGTRGVALGYNNTASGAYSVALGSRSQATNLNSIAIGGWSASGGPLASGQFSVALGFGGQAVGDYSFAVGSGAYASGSNAVAFQGARAEQNHSIAFGANTKGYFEYGFSLANGRFASNGDAQISFFPRKTEATLTSGGTTTLNGGTPEGFNRAWNVTVKWVAVCTATGSGTTAVGDVAIATDSFMFKRVSGTSSIGSVQNLQNSQDATMAGATCSYAVGGSQDLQITFTAPASANATTFRVVAKVELTEVAW